MKTIIIDYEPNHFHSIEEKILSAFPQISIHGYATTSEEALSLIAKVNPALVFIELNMQKLNAYQILSQTAHHNFETIIVAHNFEKICEAFQYQISGFLLKPLKIKDTLFAIQVAENRIQIKRENKHHKTNGLDLQDTLLPGNLIGIPTLDGFDFLSIQNIIRCEGFQRCTRIVTINKTDILSSYHIGVFKKRLEPFCFYSTHKSHLINLIHIKKYLKEGSIKMSDGKFVPVSKRRKSEFLKFITHLR